MIMSALMVWLFVWESGAFAGYFHLNDTAVCTREWSVVSGKCPHRFW